MIIFHLLFMSLLSVAQVWKHTFVTVNRYFFALVTLCGSLRRSTAKSALW